MFKIFSPIIWWNLCSLCKLSSSSFLMGFRKAYIKRSNILQIYAKNQFARIVAVSFWTQKCPNFAVFFSGKSLKQYFESDTDVWEILQIFCWTVWLFSLEFFEYQPINCKICSKKNSKAELRKKFTFSQNFHLRMSQVQRGGEGVAELGTMSQVCDFIFFEAFP